MPTKFIDDVEVVDPGSISIEIPHLCVLPRLFADTPPQETLLDRHLHDGDGMALSSKFRCSISHRYECLARVEGGVEPQVW
jgi:hypothetical protein